MSNGNAEGLGREREKELEKSCRNLGFAEAPHIVDDNELQDGMETKWASGVVANHVRQYLNRKAAEGEDQKIDIIVTFDEYGVSYHPNHISVFEGLKELMCSHEIEFELYTLHTVHFLRKYIAYSDIGLCDVSQYHCFNANPAAAMSALAIHHTQFVWFRRLWVIFARYTYVCSFNRYLQTKHDNVDTGDEDLKSSRVSEDTQTSKHSQSKQD